MTEKKEENQIQCLATVSVTFPAPAIASAPAPAPAQEASPIVASHKRKRASVSQAQDGGESRRALKKKRRSHKPKNPRSDSLKEPEKEDSWEGKLMDMAALGGDFDVTDQGEVLWDFSKFLGQDFQYF